MNILSYTITIILLGSGSAVIAGVPVWDQCRLNLRRPLSRHLSTHSFPTSLTLFPFSSPHTHLIHSQPHHIQNTNTSQSVFHTSLSHTKRTQSHTQLSVHTPYAVRHTSFSRFLLIPVTANIQLKSCISAACPYSTTVTVRCRSYDRQVYRLRCFCGSQLKPVSVPSPFNPSSINVAHIPSNPFTPITSILTINHPHRSYRKGSAGTKHNLRSGGKFEIIIYGKENSVLPYNS